MPASASALKPHGCCLPSLSVIDIIGVVVSYMLKSMIKGMKFGPKSRPARDGTLENQKSLLNSLNESAAQQEILCTQR